MSFLLAPGAAAQDTSDENVPVPGVTVSPTYLNIPEGQERTYTIVLNTRPTAQVRVTLAVSGDQRNSASEFLCCRGSWAIFTPDTWNRPRTFRVAALEEPGTVDGTLWVRHWAESDDPDYHAIPVATVTAKAKDNDVPATAGAGVTVSPTALRVPEGGSSTYTVVLNARPQVNVTIRPTIASGDADLSVTPPHVTFRASDWSTPRTFTVSAAQDSDAADGSATITHAANSSDPGYDGNAVTIAGVTATEQDDDRHGVTVSPTALAVPEGGSRTYTVALKTRPSGPVTVRPTIAGDADLRVTPAARTFTPANWNAAQAFTVSASRDVDASDGTATITHTASGGGYSGISIASVAVREQDGDTPGVTVTPTYLTIPEGQSRSYTVVLNTRPTAGVNVRVAISDDQGTGTEFGCCGRSSVWFGPNDWNHPETFTVTAPEEPGTANGTLWVRHWAESDDPDYHGIAVARVTAVAQDNDVAPAVGAGVTVTPTALRVPEGGSRTYTVVLNAPPNANVSVRPMIASGDADLSVTPPHVTFRASDWTTPRTFTVYAAHDSDAADGSATIAHAANSSDPGYDGIFIASVTATEQDDDRHGVTVSPTYVTIPEGQSRTYTVALETRPAAPVTVFPTILGDADLSVTPAARTFTPSNWTAAQAFTVWAAADVDASDGTATITHTAVGGGYDGIFIPAVAVSEQDDDTPGVTVSQTTLTIPEGESRSYTVVLNTRPTRAGAREGGGLRRPGHRHGVPLLRPLVGVVGPERLEPSGDLQGGRPRGARHGQRHPLGAALDR